MCRRRPHRPHKQHKPPTRAPPAQPTTLRIARLTQHERRRREGGGGRMSEQTKCLPADQCHSVAGTLVP